MGAKPRTKRYSFDRIRIRPAKTDPACYWEFQGRVSKGTIHHYAVTDENTSPPGQWWFAIFEPKPHVKGTYVQVQVLDYPRMRKWTRIARSTIGLSKATVGKHRGRVYAKIHIADPTGDRNYVRINRDTAHLLPKWFTGLEIVPKEKVATTRGHDSDSLVAVFDGRDHAGMIRLFFATKAWILHKGVVMK